MFARPSAPPRPCRPLTLSTIHWDVQSVVDPGAARHPPAPGAPPAVMSFSVITSRLEVLRYLVILNIPGPDPNARYWGPFVPPPLTENHGSTR